MPRIAVLTVAFLFVACETAAPPTTATSVPETATTATAPTTTTTATTVPAEPVVLAHSFRPGDTLAYHVEVRREVVLTTEGAPEAPLGDVPDSARVVATMAGTVEFEVAEAGRTGVRLLPSGDLDDLTLEGTVDEAPVEELADLGALAEIVAMPAELIVEPSGLLRDPQSDASVRLLADPFGRWSGFLGPVLAGEEAVRGGAWSRSLAGKQVTGRVSDTDEQHGREEAAVEGVVAAPAEENDLSAFYADFLTAFGDMEVEPRLTVREEPGQERWQGVFRPAAGRLVQSTVSGVSRSEVRGVAPDPDTGEAVEFRIEVESRDELEARLAGSPEG